MPDETRDALPDHSTCACERGDVMGNYRDAWKARGRELNELYAALTAVVEESAPGFDPVADLQALGTQRDRLRAENEELRGIARENQAEATKAWTENEALKMRADESDRALRMFQAGLTDTLRVYNVPAMPSWPEAIHWLARNGRRQSDENGAPQ